MPVYPSEAETGGGKGIVWLDESGGYIQIAIANTGYTSLHKFHVIPFASDGTYSAPGGSQEIDLQSTAANIIALLQPAFATTTTLTPVAVYQSNSAHDGVSPFSYSFPSGLTVAGTSGSPASHPSVQISLTAHGNDLSRWQIHVNGVATNFWTNPTRFLATLAGDSIAQLGQYLIMGRTGPGLAGHGVGKDTAVVSHSGQPLTSPCFLVYSVNKRIRRRLGIA